MLIDINISCMLQLIYNQMLPKRVCPLLMITGEIRAFREKLRQLLREMGWQFKNDAICCGVTVAQCHALLEIEKEGAISLRDLAEVLGLDISTLSRTIDNMVQTGLVARRANPEDRRYVAISLTEKGMEITGTIDRTYNDYFAAVFQKIPPHKRDQVIESIYLLADALGDINSNSCCQGGDNNG